LNCDRYLNVCRWTQPCNTVTGLDDKYITIVVQDHTDPSKTVELKTFIKDVLLDGSNFGQPPNKSCYIPIFESNLDATSSDIMNQWFVGNLFVRDKVLVFDNAYHRNQNLNP
jgi:hypothetical protein